ISMTMQAAALRMSRQMMRAIDVLSNSKLHTDSSNCRPCKRVDFLFYHSKNNPESYLCHAQSFHIAMLLLPACSYVRARTCRPKRTGSPGAIGRQTESHPE